MNHALAAEATLLRPLDRFIIAMLPDGCRDGIAGDLLEEAAMIASESGVDEARRWIRAQFISSLPSIVALHFRQKEDDHMKRIKWIAAPVLVVLGSVQAWDSGILNAPILIGIIVALAIAVGVAGVFVDHEGVRFGIGILVLLLLIVARIVSPVSLSGLGLVGMPIFLFLILAPRLLSASNTRHGGPGTAA